RQPQPVRLANEDNSSWAEALGQKFNGAGDSPTDPCSADAGSDPGLFVSNIAGSVAVDELQSIGDPELFGTQFRLVGEQLAHVDTSAANPVVACPSAQHLARTAAEVQNMGCWFQTQRCAESGELVARERIMDTVLAFGDFKNPRNTQLRKSFLVIRKTGSMFLVTPKSAIACPIGWSGFSLSA